MSSVQNLGELDADLAYQKLLFLRQMIAEELPDLQVTHGVVNDLVLNPAALLATARDEDIDRMRKSNSLAAIEEDPTLADDDYVDALLSNFYKMTRTTGTSASGTITIVISEALTTSIPSGAIFTSGSLQFAAPTAYVAVADEANATADNDRVLVERADGNYAFNIDLEAVEPGLAGMLKRGTALTASFSIRNLVTIYVAEDFTGGVETETNAQLLVRLPEGIASRTLTGRTNIAAVIRDTYAETMAVSVIGYGDSEMLRDRHSVLPISLGGRVDCYVQTAELPTESVATKEATLTAITAGVGTWQCSFTRDEYPGFYDVVKVVPDGSTESTGSLELVSTVRGLDAETTLGQLTPDIETAEEAAFTPYQTVTIRFYDDITDHTELTVGDTADYEVTLRGMPDLAGIQSLLADRDMHNPAGDILVKAPIPCFTRLSFTLEAKPGAELPDYSEIQQALARYVNSLGFTGRLSASSLTAIIYASLSAGVTVSAIDMFGQIQRPDGTFKTLRSTETLVVPEEPEDMVTPQTVLFFLDPRSVAISLQLVNIP